MNKIKKLFTIFKWSAVVTVISWVLLLIIENNYTIILNAFFGLASITLLFICIIDLIDYHIKNENSKGSL